jgi:uncharacterized membrane protein
MQFHVLAALLAPGPTATTQIILRWVHLLAGITWIGLLYFFNLVANPVMKQMDAGTRARVAPALLSRGLWWFRWSALLTVLAGIAYWMNIWSFFLIWTLAFAVENALVMPLKGPLNHGLFLGILVAMDVAVAAWLYVHFNNHGWESNRLLAIGIGGGIGWMLLLNVWGIVWRIQKRIILWTRAFAEQGTPLPEKAQRMSRQAFLVSQISAWLTLPLLFFMGAASHFPILGK